MCGNRPTFSKFGDLSFTLLPLALGAVLGVLSGCRSKPAAPPKDDLLAKESPAAKAAAVAQRKEEIASALTPVIHELGSEGTIPNKVIIELGRALVGDEKLKKKVSAATVLKIEPAVDGELRFEGPSTLAFVPKSSFAPHTSYAVSLLSVETPAGKITPPPGQTWIQNFTTPEFRFMEATLGEVDLGSEPQETPARPPKFTILLRFSGAVEAPQVGKLVSVLLEGAPVAKLKTGVTDDNNVVELSATPAVLKPGGTLEVRLKPGVELLGHPAQRLPAAQAKLPVRDPKGSKPVTIMKARHGEGANGHYIEVICSDEAAPGPTHGFWDEEMSGRILSNRCQIDSESARDRVRISPAVKVTVAPARDGFRLLGEFRRGTYAVKILAGARTLDGGVVEATFSESVSIPARTPHISFVSTGRYLPRTAWRSLPINHINSDEVTLVVRQVPPENMLFWMTEPNDETASERTSNVILKKELKLHGEPDVQKTSWLDVGALLPSTTKGLIELSLRIGTEERPQTTARLVLTNLNIVAKRSTATPDEPASVQVWALDMDTTEPQRGVEVRLVRPSGLSIARCVTTGPAGCLLRPSKDQVDTTEPVALIAQRGDDLTYLKFSDLKTEVANTGSFGEPYRSDTVYRAALYSDRGVYRPGETAHLVGIVRERKLAAPAANLPLVVEIKDPQTNLYKRASLATNAAGLWALDVAFPGEPTLGKYTARALVGGKEIGSYEIQCEEFVPERLKVTAAPQKSDYLEGESAVIDVSAQYLFGTVAAGNGAELSCELVPADFAPSENGNYHYGVWRVNEPRGMSLGKDNGSLDATGQRTLTCPEPPDDKVRFFGTAEVRAQVAVQEGESGRTTVAKATVMVHPERYYIGLLTGVKRAGSGDRIPVNGIVVDWTGKINTSVKEIDLEYLHIEEDYGWYYEEGSGDSEWKRYRHTSSAGKSKVTVQNGRFTAQFSPASAADGYLIRATAGKARTDLEIDGAGYNSWRWGDMEESRNDATPRPLRPTPLLINGPERVQVGGQAEVKVKAPYRGHILFTAETDRVLAAEWVPVTAEGEVKWSFSVGEFVPNVYVSAFLVKDPHLQSAESFMPDRAFGLLSLPVDPAAYTLGVKIDAPKEVRSHSRLNIKLDLGQLSGPTFVTVAAVDAGILSLTGFKSPDPLSHFLQRRQLGVDTFETVGWSMLLSPMGASRATGGGDGGGSDLGGRVSPIKPVALWSGIVAVPENGQLTIPFDVPTYRGELRVMVVAANKQRIGHSSTNVLVRDPLTLQTTVPRFLLAGDDFTVPVMVSNLSGAARDVTVTLQAETRPMAGVDPPEGQTAPLIFSTSPKAVLKLKKDQTATARFSAKVMQALGAAKLTVVAKSGGLESREELELPLLPAGPRERIVQIVELKPGELDLLPYLKGWLPTSERSTFWFTNNPYADVFDHLGHLIHYPYGCIEQTTSSTRPLLYLPDLVASIDPALVADKKVEEMVLAGIHRVWSMQTPAGGFAFWPGGTQPYPWGTAYATHMLLDAQKLGYAVSQSRLDDALRYIEDTLTHEYEVGRRVHDSYHYSDSDEPYLQYVLAVAGRGRKARLQQLLDVYKAIATLRGDQRENIYLLKAALYLAGDHRYERDLKDPDISPLRDDRYNNWSLYSDRRARGFELSIFSDLFGAAPEGDKLAGLVADALRGHTSSYYTTQELVWGITALGKRLGKLASDVGIPTLLANGQKRAAKSRGSNHTWSLSRASEYKALQLKVPAAKGGKLYLLISSAGVRVTPSARPLSAGISLDRTYRDASGKEIAIDAKQGAFEVSLGDMIYVELEIANRGTERVSNIALVDRLPAGWEIENPRLGREHAVDWIKEDMSWSQDHMNLRDDRLEVFGSLEPKETRRVIYALRAVTAGRFTVPEASSEAMYDPRVAAHTSSETVRIIGPDIANHEAGSK